MKETLSMNSDSMIGFLYNFIYRLNFNSQILKMQVYNDRWTEQIRDVVPASVQTMFHREPEVDLLDQDQVKEYLESDQPYEASFVFLQKK